MVNTKNACRKVNALLVRYLVHQTQDQTNNNADKNPWIFYFPRKFFVTSKMAQYLNEALMGFGRFQTNTKNECLDLSWNVDSSNFPLLKKILEHWKSLEVWCFLTVAVIWLWQVTWSLHFLSQKENWSSWLKSAFFENAMKNLANCGILSGRCQARQYMCCARVSGFWVLSAMSTRTEHASIESAFFLSLDVYLRREKINANIRHLIQGNVNCSKFLASCE